MSRNTDALLAWYFVLVWGSGFIATKAGLLYAAPFTFLALRYTFGLLLLVPLVLVLRAPWPGRREVMHVLVAGLLMHAVHLGGSHYAQYSGMSAGITALILALQPLLTALISRHGLQRQVGAMQWGGIVLGLGGVALVVWHKIDTQTLQSASLLAVTVALLAITAGTLYQRQFCPNVDLNTAAVLQFAASWLVVAPLSLGVEGARVEWSWQLAGSIVFLVVFASILAVNALHTLMRHGEAARVTSLFYLTPIIAVVLEGLFFNVLPGWVTLLGIALTSAGVAAVSLGARAAASPATISTRNP